MPQIVEIEGVGELEFPDGMSDADIVAAINTNFPELAPQPEPGLIDRAASFFQRDPQQPDTYQEDFGTEGLDLQQRQPEPAPIEPTGRQAPRVRNARVTPTDTGAAPVDRRAPRMLQQPVEPQEPTIDGFTGAARRVEEVPDFNAGRAAIERAGDVAAGLGTTITTAAEAAEDTFGLGGFVWDDQGFRYLNSDEYANYLQQGGTEALAVATDKLKNVDAGYVPDNTWESVKEAFSEGGPLSASAYGEVLAYGFEQGVKSIPDMVAAVLSLPTYVIARSGEIGEARAENKNKDKVELVDIVEAAPFALGSAILERIGAKGITEAGAEAIGKEALKRGVKEASKRVAKEGGKATLREAGTEFVQEGVIEYVGERLGTDAAMSVAEAFELGVAGAVAGGVYGGGAGTATAGARELARPTPQAQLGRALQEEVEGAQFATPADQAAAQSLSPDQAQFEAVPEKPTMAELLRERLEARGVDVAAAAQITPEMVTAAQQAAGQMPGSFDVQLEAPQAVEATPTEAEQPTEAQQVKNVTPEVRKVTPEQAREANERITQRQREQAGRAATGQIIDITQRIDNVRKEKSPESIAKKSAVVRRKIEESQIPDEQKAELLAELEQAQPDQVSQEEKQKVFPGVKRGEVGEKLAEGDTRITAGGNRTTPFPKVDVSTDRKAQNTLKRVDQWLIQNAINEAQARGDDFNLRQFQGISLNNISQSDKDSAEQYLFGDEQPDIPRSILRDIGQEVVADEPTELDRQGQEPLAGVPADEVPGAEGERPARERAEERSRADVPGTEPTGEPGIQPRGSVGEREGELPVSAERGRRAAGTEPGERAVSGGIESEQPGATSRQPVTRGDKAQVEAKEKAAEEAPTPTGTNNPPTTAGKRPAPMFTITEETGIGEGGAKTKFKNNLAAIKTLKTLQEESREATPEEQQTLARYVGWGGIPQAFYGEGGKASKGWEKEAQQLRDALSEAEYDAARRSTQDAHYTSREIVTAMWKALKDMGYAGGKVLEPSVGTGNFIGMMPAGVRSKSEINAVELDNITGGIASYLYPAANIQTPIGFQDFAMPDGYFDLAIGNPPFGSQKLYDGKRKHLSKFSIHNYFFAKSVDGLKPGGVLAMVVSSRLMDTTGDKARQYISDRTELLGAVRLPNNAFLKNAGTEVTTDIIFLRKLRDGESPGQSWMNSETVQDAKGVDVPLNEYFVRNPEMMLGEWGAYGSMYGPNEPALVARPGQDTSALLAEALAKLPKGIMEKPNRAPVEERVELTTSIDNVKVGSMFLDGDKVMVRQEDRLGQPQAEEVELSSDKARKRVTGMIRVRDVFTDLRKAQLSENVTDKALSTLRTRLNREYDKFVKANGPINADANKRLFRDDPTWPQIAALEESFDKGITPAMAKKTGEQPRKPSAKKAAIFEKRTQSPYKAPEKATSAKDALASSLSELGRVDMDYMARLYGKTPERIADELGPLVFEVVPGEWETRDAYLSGNVKRRLALTEQLAEKMPRFKRNVEALKEVQPEDIEAVDIDVKPGAHWMPREDMKAFADHILGNDSGAAVYIPMNAKWEIRGNPTEGSRSQWATTRVPVEDIINATANQKTITVRDRFEDGSSVVNEAATTAANEKVERMKVEFRRWIWQDDARRNRLTRIYNDTFNTDRLREYDGSHLQFPGKVGDDIIKLRPHQANAVWRMVQSGTTLLDHVVGAGKTFTMIAGAMEMRRMGRAKKPMFVVPNHLVGQWAEDFTKLYPGANVLAATKKDFEKSNRKRLFARIATGDWDAVIVAHSSFGKVEMDPVFQERFINQQIKDIDEAIATLRQETGGKSRSVKQIEKQKERLQEKLKKLFDADNKDDSLKFGELGVDAVFVDEAHEFKNLGFATSMTRVAGLGNPQGSQKAADLFMKTQYVLEKTGGNNVVFATGTPISNTMAEMFTIQRFLDYAALQDQGLAHFDAWSRMYGEVVSEWELSASNTYKMKSRFSKFVNIPELMQRYLTFGDVINRDDINRQLAAQGKRLPVPNIKGGKPQNVVVERSEDQANYIGVPEVVNGNEVYPEGSLVWRSEHIPKKPEKGADNMLSIMSDARKAALDMRMIDQAMYGDYEGSKINNAADSIKGIYDQWADDKGAQLVFIDLSTPKGAKAKEAARIRALIERAEQGDEAASEALDKMSPDELSAIDGDFSVYDDLRQKLIDKGIPDNEIAFIHDANTELQKEELFGKVRSGRIRVLFGSTAKMGAGMNVQERLVALHHLDAPWRPSDLEQREGRIIRQGNALYERDPDGFQIEIRRYATKQTLDSMMWQTLETKARFIEQVRKGNTTTREIEDIGGEAANSAEMKAASSGNPLILEEMELRRKLRKLEQLESEHDREQFRLRDTIRSLKRESENIKSRLMRLTKDAKKAEQAPKELSITIDGKKYDKHKEAGTAILVAAAEMADKGQEVRQIGSIYGFDLALENISGSEFVVSIQGEAEQQVDIANIAEADPTGLTRRIVNTIRFIPGELKENTNRLKQVEKDIPILEKQVGDWEQAEELANTKARHRLVIDELKPKERTEPQESATSSMMAAAGADTPMPNWRPTYRQSGVPPRPEGDTFDIGQRTVKLKPEDSPTRREGIRVMLQDIIGPRIYQGKVRGKAKLGFYRRNNSEVRIANYDDVEVMAHEMAHYLDMHYRLSKLFTRSYRDTRYRDEVAGMSYTSNQKLKYKEGFAEFVRLWLTNYQAAQQAAPLYTVRFEEVLAQDSTLDKKMRRLQEEMHRWYLQGAAAQLRAKSGKEMSQSQQVMEYLQTYPLERYRQEVIDKIHAAKVIERTVHGDLLDAPTSAYKQFQLVNGAESMHESVMKDGTPRLEADGTYSISGKGLNDIFRPVSKHGWNRFNLLMDYFKARRARELMQQGRERLFTKQEIEAGLKLGVTYPDFPRVFEEYQEFNGRMLDFYEDMGLIDKKQRKTFAEANQNYVPFHRVIERLEDGEEGGASAIGKRLTGGSMNTRDIAENIVESLYANVRAALIARAKQTLYKDIMTSQDGALFAAKLAPDSRLVRVEQRQMAVKVAQAMSELGLTVSNNGMIISGDPEAEITDVEDIAEILENNPDLLNFWTFGNKPSTAETYVDSVIIDGKRVWFEVKSPLLVNMLTGMRGFRSGALLNAMFRVKNLQTRTVTSMLQFLGPNAIRDTVSAFVISKNRFIPIYDTLIGMGDAIFNTKTYKEFRLHGGGYGTRIEARTEETRSRRQIDLPSRNGWDVAAKLLAGYDRFASAFEYGSRLGDYRRSRKAGKNALEAAWEAREVATDFSKMGRNELWAKFLRTVPFMNAGIQGLDKTAREIFEIKGEMTGTNLARMSDAKLRFLMAGGVLTLGTLILWLINQDDERYQALTPDQKARFWWIWIPGVEKPLKIPRPYDVGHLFATIPEVALDFIQNRDGRDAARTLAWTFANTLGVGDYPGILQPIVEVARNKKFTGAPVVPVRLLNTPAEYQFTDRTPQLYRSLGETLGVSPLVAEHFAKGYLRYVEAYIADGTEALLWNADEWGQRPFARGGPIDYLTYQFKGQRVPYRTKWTEQYFELKKKAAGAKTAFNMLVAQSIRDGEPLENFVQDEANRLLIGLDASFRQIDQAFEDQDKILASIKYNSVMSADEKERRIESYYAQKNKALSQFYQQADKAVQKIEDAMP